MIESTSKQRYFGIYIRGVAMGAADVVPGVSGGTVAFITGIYEELLNSIRSINPQAVSILMKQGIGECWRYINGSFLLTLMLGVLTSVLSLARLISYLLANQPLLVWSFFFGLIVASAIHIVRQINHWQIGSVLALLFGALVAYLIGELKPSELPADLPLVFLAGCIAICAMILPGISGSFILVLLGMYGHILTAVKDFNITLLAVFALGCGVGLLSFSHLLSWLFARFHNITMALLTGFLVGSLNLVWPWKQTLTEYENSKGIKMALEQENVWPGTYQMISGSDSATFWCVGLMISGLVLVFLLENIGRKTQ